MKIFFNSNIYKKSIILLSIDEFNHLAEFKLKYKKDIFELNIDNIDDDYRDVIEGEFCNYVLFLMCKSNSSN